MNILSTYFGFLGLGLPELIVIVVAFAVIAAILGFFAWAIAALIRGRRAPDAARLPTSALGTTHKKCPDCAELVLSEARVCKHCGYRFSNAVKTPL